MKWEKSILALVSILENPLVENGYRELKKYYELNNMNYEVECIDFLIKEKFKNAHNADIS
jgi:hypothetical protein